MKCTISYASRCASSTSSDQQLPTSRCFPAHPRVDMKFQLESASHHWQVKRTERLAFERCSPTSNNKSNDSHTTSVSSSVPCSTMATTTTTTKAARVQARRSTPDPKNCAAASSSGSSSVDFRLMGLKMALAEAVMYHHSKGSDRLAKLLYLRPDQVQCERGSKGELILQPSRAKAARGAKPFVFHFRQQRVRTSPALISSACSSSSSSSSTSSNSSVSSTTTSVRRRAIGHYGLPDYCFCVLLLDLENLVESHGIDAAFASIQNLQIWK